MKTDKLEPTAWKAYLDDVSSQLEGKQAHVEVASLEIGDQVEAEWLPLFGISYDPRSGHIDIAMQGVNHRIDEPKDLFVVWSDEGPSAMEIVQEDDTKQIVRLRNPIALPPPSA